MGFILGVIVFIFFCFVIVEGIKAIWKALFDDC